MKREYGRNRYHKMSKENKEKLKESQKNYRKAKNFHRKFLSFSLHCIKWKKVLIFAEDYVIKNNFHLSKKPINIDKVDIKKVMLSNKESYGNKGSCKYFTGYICEGNALLSPWCIQFDTPLCKWMHVINILIKIINAWIF